ncbi:sulfatase-like hydrolase/transferase, partial [Oenococcus oeni]
DKYTFDIKSTYNRSSWESTEVKTYVQGLNYTDDSTEKFIEALNKIKRPITVVWYGDHLPGIYDSEMKDSKNLLKLHETDYFIYSNKASKSHSTKLTDNTSYTSPNYFQALAAEHMNTKVSPFLALLTELREQIPASSNALAKNGSALWEPNENKNIYLNNSGEQVNNSDLTKEQKQLLKDYKMVQYDITRGKHYVKNDGFMKVPSK